MDFKAFMQMKPVLPSHVVIDNFPSASPWYQLWIPVFIAFISIIISGYSMYYTRKSFAVNTRPYVWATNYGYLDNGIIIPKPSAIMLICKEYPAKFHYKFEIYFNNA